MTNVRFFSAIAPKHKIFAKRTQGNRKQQPPEAEHPPKSRQRKQNKNGMQLQFLPDCLRHDENAVHLLQEKNQHRRIDRLHGRTAEKSCKHRQKKRHHRPEIRNQIRKAGNQTNQNSMRQTAENNTAMTDASRSCPLR